MGMMGCLPTSRSHILVCVTKQCASRRGHESLAGVTAAAGVYDLKEMYDQNVETVQ